MVRLVRSAGCPALSSHWSRCVYEPLSLRFKPRYLTERVLVRTRSIDGRHPHAQHSQIHAELALVSDQSFIKSSSFIPPMMPIACVTASSDAVVISPPCFDHPSGRQTPWRQGVAVLAQSWQNVFDVGNCAHIRGADMQKEPEASLSIHSPARQMYRTSLVGSARMILPELPWMRW